MFINIRSLTDRVLLLGACRSRASLHSFKYESFQRRKVAQWGPPPFRDRVNSQDGTSTAKDCQTSPKNDRKPPQPSPLDIAVRGGIALPITEFSCPGKDGEQLQPPGSESTPLGASQSSAPLWSFEKISLQTRSDFSRGDPLPPANPALKLLAALTPDLQEVFTQAPGFDGRGISFSQGHVSNRDNSTQISILGILASFLEQNRVSRFAALQGLYQPDVQSYLQTRQYSTGDVVSWAELFSHPNANAICANFVALSTGLASTNLTPLPSSLLHFILYARSLSAAAFRGLLDHITHLYTSPDPGNLRPVNVETTREMTSQLLQQARVVLPQSIEDVVSLVTRMMTRERAEPYTPSCLSSFYNQLLGLLAATVPARPYLSVPIQQRAQLRLVKEMASFEPQLQITREGFRGLVRVQLAHRKVESEKDWAHLKADSWPPWKQQLSGLDVDSLDPGQISRANDVLNTMVEAGYSHTSWELTARIFAGWDVDGTPTVQTRKLLALPTDEEQISEDGPVADQPGIWSGRILATRTIREAWACFESFEKTSQCTKSPEPFNAMLTRLLNAYFFNPDALEDVQPGDGMETWPEPMSELNQTYVSREPDTARTFCDRMIRHNIQIDGRLLDRLLEQSRSFTEGAKYIKAVIPNPDEHLALLGYRFAGTVSTLRDTLQNMEPNLIAAVIRFYCQISAFDPSHPVRRLLIGLKTLEPLQRVHTTASPFFFAQNLLGALNPSSPLPWYAMVRGWNRRTNISLRRTRQHWERINSVLNAMDHRDFHIDFNAFRDIAELIEKFLREHQTGWQTRPSSRPDQARSITASYANLCKKFFLVVTYGGNLREHRLTAKSDDWLALDAPSRYIIDTPTPAALHRTIRILGIATSRASIVSLLRWMDVSAPTLAATANELSNSKKMMRRAMAAVRLFLEDGWRPEECGPVRNLAEGQDQDQMALVEEARAIIDAHWDDWGGWATEEEVEMYIMRMKREQWPLLM